MEKWKKQGYSAKDRPFARYRNCGTIKSKKKNKVRIKRSVAKRREKKIWTGM
jgi:hypothetical protein